MRTVGDAAAIQDAEQRVPYENISPRSYAFMPLSTETFGQMGMASTVLINKLSARAVGESMGKGALLASSLTELSVSLCKGSGVLYRCSLGFLLVLVGVCSWQECLFQLWTFPKRYVDCFSSARLLSFANC